jgi:CRP-like cAMP-binding protein
LIYIKTDWLFIKKQKKKLKPGHYFGGISLFGPQPQYETVTATARSEILVIALQYLEKFKRLYPDAYLQILQNFTSSVD